MGWELGWQQSSCWRMKNQPTSQPPTSGALGMSRVPQSLLSWNGQEALSRSSCRTPALAGDVPHHSPSWLSAFPDLIACFSSLPCCGGNRNLGCPILAGLAALVSFSYLSAVTLGMALAGLAAFSYLSGVIFLLTCCYFGAALQRLLGLLSEPFEGS